MWFITQCFRLASPAERWGGFGTCVRSKAPGPHSSPTPEAQPSNDSDNEAARQNTQQKGLSLPRRSPGATTGQPLCAGLANSDLLTPSAKVPNAGGYLPHKLMGTHSDLLFPPRSKTGCQPADSDQTTSNTDPDKARRAQTRCASRKACSDQQHTAPEPAQQ